MLLRQDSLSPPLPGLVLDIYSHKMRNSFYFVIACPHGRMYRRKNWLVVNFRSLSRTPNSLKYLTNLKYIFPDSEQRREC